MKTRVSLRYFVSYCRNIRIEIYIRSAFRNNSVKVALKKMKNCIKTKRHMRCPQEKMHKEYFQNITDNNIVTNKKSWNFIRLFIVYKDPSNS